MKRSVVLVVVGSLLLAALGAAPPAAATPDASSGPTVYVGELTPAQLAQAGRLGVDHGDVTSRGAAPGGKVKVELVLSPLQAAKLQGLGLGLQEKQIGGRPVSKRLDSKAASGYTVFRSYSQPGGIADELRGLARQYPSLTKLVTIGTTVQGKPILAIKVSRDARTVKDGRRPSVLYVSTQHAREWITPEMNRRLLHYYLERYAVDAAVKKVVDTRELWFVPVANPDGYDYTFTAGHRLWRKNLRDNDGDGQITGLDGVDLNRNFSYQWGYDNEGSSSSFASDTYRGKSAGSEPETRALDKLMRRIRFTFLIDYHSAAELLLYGVGSQVATPSPDDLLYEALLGDDAHPAVPGYDPDLSAELYTTNGETTEHAENKYGTLAFTPEMSTCETASNLDPNDAFNPDDCESVFNFPDSEALVQAEFAKNLPLALAVARSAGHPADPESVVGRTAPDFAVHSFDVSYGDPQTVAVTARRDLRKLSMRYSINGRKAKRVRVHEWRGGERYGDSGNVYYAEFRGLVRGAKPGDHVRVWFTGKRPQHATSTSTSFSYALAEDTRHTVLVLANEDYEGVNPTYPASVTAPKYAAGYVAALKAKGYKASVWDVSKQGVPDHLGVLGHFKAVVWYLGDNRLTQDPAQAETDIFGDEVPDAAVARRQEDLTISVRDYLNEHGKLIHTGETAGYFGTLGSTLGGIYYGLDGAPDSDCVVTVDLFSDCLLLADDFYQYYLGAFTRNPISSPTAYEAAGKLAGAGGTFGGPAVAANPLNEPGTFTPTSSVLPVKQFPLFASRAAGSYRGGDGGVYDPVEGSWYAGTLHLDDAYARLAQTVDLRPTTAAGQPRLNAKLSFDTEEGYDHVIVEAHTVGRDDWTTLPELGGLTSTAVPADCEQGFLIEEHPFLAHYLTLGDTACTATGTTGSWNSMTGNSGGWQPASFDLSAYAGRQVEVVISYVSDPAGGGVGLFVDDTSVTAGGTSLTANGFETGLGGWRPLGPPAGSPPSAATFQRSQGLLAAAITTKDTVLFGFGVEQIASPAERARLLARSLKYLLS